MGRSSANTGIRFVAHMALVLLATGVLAQLAAAEQSVPPDPKTMVVDYTLGPGDYLLAELFDGEEKQEHYIQLDTEGDVVLPLVGNINIMDMSLREAADAITEKYRTYYLNPHASLKLLQYGTFNTYIFGADIPGEYYVARNGGTLLALLTQLELENPAAYRRVHVVRGGFNLDVLLDMMQSDEDSQAADTANLMSYTNWRGWIKVREQDPDSEVIVVDPLKLTVEGELSRYNIRLEPNDVIYLPAAESMVEIVGTAKAGVYELLPDETLADLLRLAGSPASRSDLANTVITRYDECGRRQRLVFNIFPALTDLTAVECFALQNRDVVTIEPHEDRIFVTGQVKSGGAYIFVEDSTVLDYIAHAGGETKDAHLAWIAIIRQNRDRLNTEEPAEVIQVNFKEIHKGLPMCTDISLIPGDIIYVPPKGKEFEFSQILQAVTTGVTAIALVDNLQDNSSTTSNGNGNGE